MLTLFMAFFLGLVAGYLGTVAIKTWLLKRLDKINAPLFKKLEDLRIRSEELGRASKEAKTFEEYEAIGKELMEISPKMDEICDRIKLNNKRFFNGK